MRDERILAAAIAHVLLVFEDNTAILAVADGTLAGDAPFHLR
jgi:hypothetical protein